MVVVWCILLFNIHIVNNWLDYFMTSLLNRLFRRIWKEISKLRVTGRCEGISPGTDELSAQRANNTEKISIWWRHHVIPSQGLICRWGMYMVYQSTIRQQPKTVLYNISMEKVLNRDNGYDSSIHFWRYCWYFLWFCRTKFSTLGLIQSVLSKSKSKSTDDFLSFSNNYIKRTTAREGCRQSSIKIGNHQFRDGIYGMSSSSACPIAQFVFSSAQFHREL